MSSQWHSLSQIATISSLYIVYFFLCKVFKEQPLSDLSYKSKQVSESIIRLFPGFDAFMLPPPTVDSKLMTRLNEEKGRVNRLFWSGLENFKQLIKKTLAPKNSFNDGEYVTGEGNISNL